VKIAFKVMLIQLLLILVLNTVSEFIRCSNPNRMWYESNIEIIVSSPF